MEITEVTEVMEVMLQSYSPRVLRLQALQHGPSQSHPDYVAQHIETKTLSKMIAHRNIV